MQHCHARKNYPQMRDITVADAKYVKASADFSYRTAIVQYDVWSANPNHELNIPFLDWLFTTDIAIT